MSSGMEPEIKLHFRKVGYSFFAGLIWLLVNVTAGLYFKLAIIEKHIRLGNILFYVWFLASIGFLLYYFFRTWRLFFNLSGRK